MNNSNKTILYIVITLLVILGGYFLVQKLRGNKPSDDTSTTTTNNQTYTPITNNNGTSNNVNAADTIYIQNFTFSPATLTVPVGTTVKWINNDSVTHTVNSSSFNSPNMSTGDSYQFTFNTKGTFDYTCGIHPSMKGKIIIN